MSLFKKKNEKKVVVKKGRHHIDSNKEIGVITYLFIALFLAMLVYLGYFTQVRSKTVINNTYNKKSAASESRIFLYNH